jgi:hypothetical protein
MFLQMKLGKYDVRHDYQFKGGKKLWHPLLRLVYSKSFNVSARVFVSQTIEMHKSLPCFP